MSAPRTRRLSALALCVALAACGESEPVLDQSEDAIAPARAPLPEAPETPQGLALDRLERASVALPLLGGQRVTLVGGSWERRSPLRIITLESATHTVADFDEDGMLEAAVIVSLIEGQPRPGTPPAPFSHLVIFGGTASAVQEAVVQLPPGARVGSIASLAGGVIELNARIVRGGGGGGDDRVTLRYRYANGELNAI